MNNSIIEFSSDDDILKDLGERIKAERIRQKMTQAQLAVNSGVGKSTVERAESGESIQFVNIIKILRTLHQLSGLDALLPSSEMTPIQHLYSKSQNPPQRYYSVSDNTPPYTAGKNKSNSIWEEDK